MAQPVQDVRTGRPFYLTARPYLDAGWFPMPLKVRSKEKPPEGFTGWDNPTKKNKVKQLKARLQ